MKDPGKEGGVKRQRDGESKESEIKKVRKPKERSTNSSNYVNFDSSTKDDNKSTKIKYDEDGDEVNAEEDISFGSSMQWYAQPCPIKKLTLTEQASAHTSHKDFELIKQEAQKAYEVECAKLMKADKEDKTLRSVAQKGT
eukprot:gene25521-11262_t